MPLSNISFLKQWLLLIFCFLFAGNLQCQDKTNPLQRAYTIDSSRFFSVFINYWEQEHPAVPDSNAYKNDTIGETYRLFESFFTPFNFDTISGTALSVSYYNEHTYLVVQNSIKVSFVKRIFYTPAEIDSLGLIYTKKEPIDVNSHQSEYDYFLMKEGKIPWGTIHYNGEAVRKIFEQRLHP